MAESPSHGAGLLTLQEATSTLPLFDLPEFAGRMSQLLHNAGVPVAAERSVRFVEVLHLLPPVDRTSLYWAARLVFVTGRDQVATFDALFEMLFAGLVDPSGPRGDRNNPPLDAAEPGSRRRPPVPSAQPTSPTSAPPAPQGSGRSGRPRDSERQAEAIPTVASRDELLASKDFGAMDDEEVAAVQRLLAALIVATPLRRLRRKQPRRDGRHVDLRRTLRLCHRTGGDAAVLARSRHTMRRRPLILLCDISGSMEPYTRAYLHFFHRAAATGVKAEAFVFATQLTRLTMVLRTASAEAALQAAGARRPDWSGGTRIGQSLAEFNNRFGRRGMARGAVVVIFSDGWERDDPGAVGREMARLSRLAHRVVWVNPRKAGPHFSPQAAGMAAALPYCDAFVSGHSVAALAEVIEAIADAAGSHPRADQTAAEKGTDSASADKFREVRAMKDVLDDIDRWIAAGHRVAVARVVGLEGSGPRDPGATMAVNDHGEVAGSVSGGCVEGAVVSEAMEILAGDGQPRLVTFGYSDDQAFAVGLTCGGTIHVFIEPLDRW